MIEKKEPVVLVSFKDGRSIDSLTFADYADRFVGKVVDGKKKLAFPDTLTTSKLRGIYSMIMNIYTRINDVEDFERHKSDIKYLKVRMAYEAGRVTEIKEFLDKTLLMKAIDYIKTYEQFALYCRYAESLVAYFKFYGGKDN
jgi:CRISPR-associated protein Csm2